MKKVFRYIVSVSLSLLVLTASGGFTLSRMICLQSGSQQFAFARQQDCCIRGENAKPLIKGQCCAVYNQHISTGYYLPGFEKHLQKTFVTTTAIVKNEVVIPFSSRNSFTVYRTRPPILSGNEVLLGTCKLSI
ncbi:MAG TPA: hypothetical protein VI112_02890 [Bacteroidia bacterium]